MIDVVKIVICHFVIFKKKRVVRPLYNYIFKYIII